MKLWFPEVDILKASAILIVVFCHIDNYVSCYDLIRLVDGYVGLFGQGIFFFVSGFLLFQSDSIINSMQDIKNFYIKKFIRIFPLYWVALGSLIIIFGILQINPGHIDPYNFSLDNLLLHFFGLQGIFPIGDIQSMWFVGVIILFYLLYPIVAYFSKNLIRTFIVSSIILFLLAFLHFFFGLIEIRALTYYPFFIFGIFLNQIVYLSKKVGNENLLKQILSINLILIFVFFLVLVLRQFSHLDLIFFPSIFVICAMLSLCIIYFIFTHLYINIQGKIMLLLSLIAFGTYAIYLFHIQFLAVFTFVTDFFIQNITLQDIIILTFGFAGAIFCGIIIQKIEQHVFMKYKLNHQR